MPPRLRPPSFAVVTWGWVAAAALLLLFPVRLWTSPAGRELFDVRTTPLEATNPRAAAMWAFLSSAANRLPAGAVITVRATDPGDEMTLYMLAVSRLREVKVVPSSYYGRPLEAAGGRAELVLAWGEVAVDGSVLVERLSGGRLLRRGAP